MANEKDTADAKAAEDKLQQQADAAASKINGAAPSDGKFNWWDKIVNIFVDHDSGKPDWIKVLLTGLGGVAGAVMGADAGIMGMLVAGLIGTVAAGVLTATLVPMARNEDPNAKHRNPVLQRPVSPELNPKVITQTPVTLGNRTINIATYNPSENPEVQPGIADPKLRKAIEDLRKIAATGNPYDNASNKHLREMVDQLESKANVRELNLRYLRDTLPQAQQSAITQVEDYVSKLGPDAKQALSIRLNADLSKVPGVQGSLGGELEQYGRNIKAHLLQELAATGANISSIESQKVIDTAWDNMSVVAKRNFISNFANEAVQNAMNNRTQDARAFFPESETPAGMLGYIPSTAKSWLPDVFEATPKAEYRNAASKNPPDFETMANILDKRLATDPTLPQEYQLSDPIKQQMRALSMGMHAKSYVKKLDEYIAGPLNGELEQLSRFEAALKDQNQRITSLPSRAQAYAQGKNPALLTSIPQDVRSQVDELAIHLSPSSTDALNNLPNKPADRKKRMGSANQSTALT